MARDQVALVHPNPVAVSNGRLRVDRKFHFGMLNYVEQVKLGLHALNPELQQGQRIMDEIEVPVASLPYRIEALGVNHRGGLEADGMAKMREVIGNSRLTYGTGLSSFSISRELQRPYISIQEYDLKTQLTVATKEVANPLRRLVRASTCLWNYRSNVLAEISGAEVVHCNGFPIYDVARKHNPNSLLYLDSRMSSAMIIPAAELESRLATLRGRRIRLLYSGRYEALKGAEDAVRVGLECLRRGLDVEMHCYGQGSLRDSMEALAETAVVPARIFIHDAIPYPDLVRISRTFDIFVCCHIQNDPSCTYLESMGAGLPIVGYANRMWERLSTASGTGFCSPMGLPAKVADDIQRLAANGEQLALISRQAAEYARSHCSEIEFKKRIDSINSLI